MEPDSKAIYIALAILFSLPCSLLYLAWRCFSRADCAAEVWRRYIALGALLLAVAATAMHTIWNASWLHSGGSPHGMRAGPGIWEWLGRPMFAAFCLALACSAFAKGRARILLLAWSVSMVLVFYMVYLLQFD
jgi:hypothetical protein